jgi:hypothetical protein
MSDMMMIDVLAVIGAGTCLYWLFRILSALAQRLQTPGQTVETPTATPSPSRQTSELPTPDDIAKDHIVVIAAAVTMMLSAHRIVHIKDIRSGATWSAEGRWMHQTSHHPH